MELQSIPPFFTGVSLQILILIAIIENSPTKRLLQFALIFIHLCSCLQQCFKYTVV